MLSHSTFFLSFEKNVNAFYILHLDEHHASQNAFEFCKYQLWFVKCEFEWKAFKSISFEYVQNVFALFKAFEFWIRMTSRTENAKHFILKPYAVCTYSYVYDFILTFTRWTQIFFMFEWKKVKEGRQRQKLSFPAFHITHWNLMPFKKISNDHMLCSPFVFIQYNFQLRFDFISFPAHWTVNEKLTASRMTEYYRIQRRKIIIICFGLHRLISFSN